MFHELGHRIHYLVSRSKYAIPFSRDFVEVPSLMLENFIWEPEVLISLSKHYSRLNASFFSAWEEDVASHETTISEAPSKLPQALAENISRTKSVNAAHDMLTQIHLALFDLAVHSTQAMSETDITNLWNTIKRDVIGLKDEPGMARAGQAGFPHIFKKYDAAYFGYVTQVLPYISQCRSRMIFVTDRYLIPPLSVPSSMLLTFTGLALGKIRWKSHQGRGIVRRSWSLDPAAQKLGYSRTSWVGSRTAWHIIMNLKGPRCGHSAEGRGGVHHNFAGDGQGNKESAFHKVRVRLEKPACKEAFHSNYLGVRRSSTPT